MPLTTLQAVKSYLNISLEEVSDDERLNDLIVGCSAAIESYCQIKFSLSSYEEDYDGNGKSFILLHNYPIKTITTIEVDEQIIDPSEYKVRKNNGMLFRKGVWPQGIMNIKINYSAGFEQVPDEVELACKHLVMSYFKADIASFSTTFGEGFVFRPEALPAQVKALVSRYKRVM